MLSKVVLFSRNTDPKHRRSSALLVFNLDFRTKVFLSLSPVPSLSTPTKVLKRFVKELYRVIRGDE